VFGHLGKKLVKYFDKGKGLGVKLVYVKQNLDKYGTGYARIQELLEEK